MSRVRNPAWEGRRKLIERLVYEERLTDEEMAERFGVGEKTMAFNRRALGIFIPVRETLDVPLPPAAPMQTTTYQEGGFTITLCPPGHAIGYGLNRYTARSGAKK